jgi:hypothetical protein
MSTPQPGHDAPTIATYVPPAPHPPAPRQGGKVARRVLLTAGGLALCAGGVAATPFLLDQAKKYTEDQLANAFDAGVANARQALLNDLAQLEGVSLDAAIEVATLTKLLVTYIVLPVARLVAAIGSGGLNLLIQAVSAAKNALGLIPGSGQYQQVLQHLIDMLQSWRTGVALLPNALSTYANADITSAESYLMALKKMIAEEQNATPTPTATSGH